MADNVPQILPADLGDPRVITLLESHLRAARAQTAPGGAHALDLSRLKAPPRVSVWAAWLSGDLVGVGALKRLSGMEGDIKSRCSLPTARGRAGARSILAHVVAAARSEGVKRLSLEKALGDTSSLQESCTLPLVSLNAAIRRLPRRS